MLGLGILAQTTTDFTYTTTTDVNDAATVLGMGLGVALVAGLILYLVVSFITSFIFKKAGRQAWEAYVPVYNTWVLLEISGKPGWWILVNFIPFVGSVIFFVLYIVAMLALAKRFGKGPLFAIFGLVLFSIIGMIILAFDKSTYSASDSLGTASNPQNPMPFGTPPASNNSPTTPPSTPATSNTTVPQAPISPSAVASSQPINTPPSPIEPQAPVQQPPVSAAPEQPASNDNSTPPANPIV